MPNYCDPPIHSIQLPITTVRKDFTIEDKGVHYQVYEVHERSDGNEFRIYVDGANGKGSLDVPADGCVRVCRFRNVSFHLMDYGTVTAYNISQGDDVLLSDSVIPAPSIQIDGVMMLETKNDREDIKLRLSEGVKGEEVKRCVELARSCHGEAGRPFLFPCVRKMYYIVLI